MSTATAPKGFALEEDRGVLVATLYWESIDRESALEELRDRVVQQLPQATTAVLFDCRKLTGLASSHFLAMLVAVRKAAMREGRFVCVTHLSGPVREAYNVSRLERIIPIYDDRETGIRAVGDYGLGRIAAEKREPDLLGTSTSQEQVDEDQVLGAAVLAHQASAVFASAAESWSGVRENLRGASQSMTRVQMLQVGVIAAAVLVAAGLAWYFFVSKHAHATISTHDDRPLIFGGEARSTLAGQIQVRAGDNVYHDAGALVLVWRAGEGPQQKVLAKTIYRYLNEAKASEKFPYPWMHAARASETGRFRLGIETPGEYEALIISASSERAPTLSAADEQQLAPWFESPRALIGKHPYRLHRQRIDGAEAALDETFVRAAR